MNRHIPMLFKQEMIKALLSGHKTVMRIPAVELVPNALPVDPVIKASMIEKSSPIKPGDLIWVRETFRYYDASDECGCSEAPCGCPRTGTPLYKATHDTGEDKWKPSVHMLKDISRMTLKVISINVERVQDISMEEAFSEGCLAPLYKKNDKGYLTPPRGHTLSTSFPTAKHWFSTIWEKQYGNWEHNPLVWVVTFKAIHKNINDV